MQKKTPSHEKKESRKMKQEKNSNRFSMRKKSNIKMSCYEI